MPALKYRVTLTEDEKEMLEGLLRKGKRCPEADASKNTAQISGGLYR